MQQGHGGGYGKVIPTGPPMAPPIRMVHNQNQPANVVMPMGNQNPGGNLLSMDQWGNRYPNNQQNLRPPNQTMMPQNPMQQQVSDDFQLTRSDSDLSLPDQQMNMVVQQPQQQQPQQPMPGAQMGGIRPPQVAAGNGPQMSAVGSGVGGISAQQLQNIMQRIKSNNPGEGGGQQHLLQWLKSNPQVMAAIIKQRQAQHGQTANCAQQQQQVNGPQQQQQNVMQQQQQGNMVPGSQLQQLMGQQPQQSQGQQQQHPNQVVMGGQAVPHNRVPNVMQNTMQMQQQVGGNMQQQQGPVSIFGVI